MKDWKGNKIKAGDTIVFVSTKPLFEDFGWMIPKGNGVFEVLKLKDQPKEHCWEPREYKTQEKDGLLFYTPAEEPTDGIVRWFILDEFSMKFFSQPGEILCIKGVSDNEEEYYKQYFNV